ncbi:MAG: hypothetical protein MRY74_05180 [Neomegalonema sp.]|nr:hypothetical protein [Neomegalonema sp.]
MRPVLSLIGLVALATFFGGGGASARTYSGEAFLASVQKGKVWCVEYRASDSTCAFILKRPVLTLSADEPVVEADGYALFKMRDGSVIKIIQRFRYFSRGGRVCVHGRQVKAADVQLYQPATNDAYETDGDRRIAPEKERGMVGLLIGLWGEHETVCWGYRLEERDGALPGPEIAMTRYDGAEKPKDASFGAFFETKFGHKLRLRP